MVTVNLVQAKADLSELLDRVEVGEEVIIIRHGRAVARINPVPTPKHLLMPEDFGGVSRDYAAFAATDLRIAARGARRRAVRRRARARAFLHP